MKLAITSIMKNEERHVGEWLQGLLAELLPGDTITLLDTGSTDGTVGIVEALTEGHLGGGPVHLHRATIKPWRFDTARSAALSLADPEADMAWALDLDEFPQPGWRQAIEDAYNEGCTRLRYKFVWSQLADGSDGMVFQADKLHRRYGFRWKGLAHEWLVYDGEERHSFAPGLTVIHRQDHSVERTYRDLELMRRAIAELPDDERLQHYYARQLYFVGLNKEASDAFQVHLDNPKATWRPERAESMMYLSQVGGNEAWDLQWAYRAIGECPERREVWVNAARVEARRGNYGLAMNFLGVATKLAPGTLYLSKPEARDEHISRLLLHYLEQQAKADARLAEQEVSSE